MKRTRLALVVALLAIVLPSLSHGADARPSRPGSDIIGGKLAGATEFPFMAAILNERIRGTDFDRQICGGTLISATWVLTAAHCVVDLTKDDLAVTVGRARLSSTQGIRSKVTEVWVDPMYHDPVEDAHDAALVRLATSVNGITPIQLAATSNNALEAPGTPLTIIGWGTVKATRPAYSDDLLKANVPVVDDGVCKGIYGHWLDEMTMVCAGAAGVDSCYGDSGGPLFDYNSRIQVGIVSWGNGCAKRRYPGVYSEVNNADTRGWIFSRTGV